MSEPQEMHMPFGNGDSPSVDSPLIVPWDRWEMFLGHIDSFGLGMLVLFVDGPDRLVSLFRYLIGKGCDPYAAACLFAEGYAAPDGSILLGPDPDSEE